MNSLTNNQQQRYRSFPICKTKTTPILRLHKSNKKLKKKFDLLIIQSYYEKKYR